MIILSRFPAYAGKVPFEQELLSPGGQVASAMVACAKMGLRVKYIGTVGDDEGEGDTEEPEPFVLQKDPAKNGASLSYV